MIAINTVVGLAAFAQPRALSSFSWTHFLIHVGIGAVIGGPIGYMLGRLLRKTEKLQNQERHDEGD